MRIGLYLALAGSSLACLPWMNDAFGMVKVLVALVGVAWMWANTPREMFRGTQLDGSILVGFAVLVASTVFSVSPKLSLLGFQSQPFYGLLALSCAALIFHAVNANCYDWQDGPALCCAVVAIATGFACIIEKAGFGLPPFDLVGPGRAIGTIGNPAFMGTVVAVCVPACVWLASDDVEHWQVGRFAVLMCLVAMWASGSRGPWLAAGCGLLAYQAAMGNISKRVAVWSSVLAACAAVMWFSRLDPSDTGRYGTWLIALKGGFRYPLLGWGPDTFFVANVAIDRTAREMQASAHNDILQAWCTTGLLGLSAYMWLWWKVLRAAWFPVWGDGRHAAVFGSLVALFVAAKFNPVPSPAMFLCAALLGSLGLRVGASRWTWAIGAFVLLVAPGLAATSVIQDGSGTVEARVR